MCHAQKYFEYVLMYLFHKTIQYSQWNFYLALHYGIHLHSNIFFLRYANYDFFSYRDNART